MAGENLSGMEGNGMSEYIDETPIEEIDWLDVRGKLGIVYLAAPYSAGDEELERERVRKVTEVAGKLIDAGYYVFSPLTYTERIADNGHQPPVGWYDFDLTFLQYCGAIVVLQLDGWSESHGVKLEIQSFRRIRSKNPIMLKDGGDPVESLDWWALYAYQESEREDS